MYLSQLVLNHQQNLVHRELGNAHKLHQRIMQAFPDEQREQPRQEWNILYRQEPDSYTVLVQSDIEPDWVRLPPGYLVKHPIKPIDYSAIQFLPDQLFQFRLKANPSKRDNQTRKLIGLFRRDDQLVWLERQADKHGFVVSGVDVLPAPNVFGIKEKGTKPITIHTIFYQGVLHVTDPERSTQALQQGIGRGRSYGCGLLSIARWNPN
jgi:CRISPR system Cascade subunit CasE